VDQFITGYQTITTALLSGIQRLGVLSIPLGIGIVVLVNYFGGERAIRAVGVGIGALVLFTLVLNNAQSLGNWIQTPSAVASSGAAAVATAVPRP
jgi:hypothetical protein